MNNFVKKYPCAIPLLFLLAYGIPILALVPYYTPTMVYLSRMLGLIAFINVFTQVMLGSFRNFFTDNYNPIKIFKIHNYLGVFTLIIGFTHAIIHGWLVTGVINALTFNAGIGASIGMIGLYLMSLTVISSDLKYFFNVNYSVVVWRFIHLINYSLFPVLYFHALFLSLTLQNIVIKYLMIAFMALVMLGLINKLKILFTKKL